MIRGKNSGAGVRKFKSLACLYHLTSHILTGKLLKHLTLGSFNYKIGIINTCSDLNQHEDLVKSYTWKPSIDYYILLSECNAISIWTLGLMDIVLLCTSFSFQRSSLYLVGETNSTENTSVLTKHAYRFLDQFPKSGFKGELFELENQSSQPSSSTHDASTR